MPCTSIFCPLCGLNTLPGTRRIISQKRPLLPKRVWSIHVRFEMADNRRDLALFNTAIDSKLHGCDLVRLKVRDVFAAGRVKVTL